MSFSSLLTTVSWSIAALCLVADPVAAGLVCTRGQECLHGTLTTITGATHDSNGGQPLFPTGQSCLDACRAAGHNCQYLYWTTGLETTASLRISGCGYCTAPPVDSLSVTPANPTYPNYGCVYTPDSVGAGEDPHFKTWTGSFYDYMGECDLILIHAPQFDDKNNQTMSIAIRTKIRYQYSYIEATAVQIGEETLEVSSFGEYALNGITLAELPNTISDYPVTYAHPNEKVHMFTIDLGNDEAILLQTFKDWASVKLSNPSKARYQKSHGMMGEFGTGKLLGRDGVTVIEDPNQLAVEWQVRDNEPMLFQTARAPQYPQQCKLPDPSKTTGRRRLREASISEETAKNACLTAGTENLEGCIHDVMATGDLELAAAGIF